MKASIAAPLLLAVGLLAEPANSADVATGLRQHAVSFGDLDLARPEGAASLYARINAAARDVCALPDAPFVASIVPARRCAEAAVARAVADVDAPTLTTYYVAKSGHPLPAGASTTLRAAQPGAGADHASN